MELPEQDRQALIEAARRRGVTGKGGAAFGVMPSSGKRAEKLNVSRDVNMPAQLARGWAAGTLGLPGDIESLGRLGINLVKPGAVAEESFLPTSEFYQEYLPGGDERPAAKFASGLGALGGGMGSTTLARGAGKGAKAVGKAIAPKVGEMAQQYMHASGLAPQLTAYHGTPHKFAPEEGAPLGKFKSEKIGTGEGAQAYGHGIYFAESPGVAQSYIAAGGARPAAPPDVYAADIVGMMGGEEKALQHLKSILPPDGETAFGGESRQLIQDAIKSIQDKGYKEKSGSLYTVDIPDEMIPKMLDWDKPLSQQPEVMEALKNVEGVQYADKYFKANKKADPTGEDIHEFLRLSGYNPNQIAFAMRDAGIPGVRYLDAASRGSFKVQNTYKGKPYGEPVSFKTEEQAKQYAAEQIEKGFGADIQEGTRNFVVFPGEEEKVKILERKAEGGAVKYAEGGAVSSEDLSKPSFRYPSSGRRPEKLNVSRDVNAPVQLARGWAAGLLGLPGDVEGLGRLLRNIGPEGLSHMRNVSETPALPTSDFYREYLPGYDPAPAARAISGLGALSGGLGATKVAGAGVKGAKAAGRALGPKAAEMAEGYLQKSGLAPSVIKPKGGNWLAGSVEKGTEPLRSRGPTEADREWILQHAENQRELGQDPTRVLEGLEAIPRTEAINNWIDTKLNKYIKNEMGTPEDPVRGLAERGVSHLPAETLLNFAGHGPAPDIVAARKAAGYPELGFVEENAGDLYGGLSERQRMAIGWENLADAPISVESAGDLMSRMVHPSDMSANPWLAKVAPETPVYNMPLGNKVRTENLGFNHLIDELRNATRADSDLPANLRWKPEDLKKVTMAQAVERVAEINEWRAAQKLEADAAKARNPATFTVKEYPEQKMQWVQLKTPEMPEGWSPPEEYRIVQPPGARGTWAIMDDSTGSYIATGIKSPEQATKHLHSVKNKAALEEALKYEGDVMGHCVGGYCPDVEAGRSRIYSLRDKKGEPHVTIEVGVDPEMMDPFNRLSDKHKTLLHDLAYEEFGTAGFGHSKAADDAKAAFMERKMKELGIPIPPPPPEEILQIKGKGNAAPKEKYLPMVQDFVRSGNWSKVGDLQNTQLIAVDPGSELANALQTAGKKVPQYVTQDELTKLLAWNRGDGDVPQGYARGGLVTDTDAIAAKLKATGMDDEKAFMQALRMADARQEAHMAGGGLLKALKGSKTIGNYQALPLNLPRAPNLPPQEITKTADRIARQQMGEHVRKPKKTENLAGRSMKEAQRLKKLDIEIQPTKEIPTPTVVPERAGDVRIALPGDISIADQMLMSVDNLPIGSQQQGGPLYGAGKQDLDDPRFWASNEGPAQIFQNKVTDLSYMYETPEIMALHMSMGHDAMNFAQHFADANLRAIQASPVDPESARMFNQIIREGNEKVGQFPDFPGVENYEEAYEAMQKNPELRKWFNDRMKVDSITQPLGMPSGKEIEYAIMEPELRNMETSMTGLSVGRMKPGASLIPKSGHATYSHDIAGQALGRTKELTPFELSFPDATAHVRSTQRPQDFTGTIQKVFPHQVVDDQYINQLGEYYNRLKQIRGYKKGGKVKKSGLSVLNKAII